MGVALEHIGAAVAHGGAAAEALLAPAVLGLLRPGRPVYAHLRRKALLVVHAAVTALAAGAPPQARRRAPHRMLPCTRMHDTLSGRW